MDKVTSIPLQDWMKREDTRRVMGALGQGSALFVGGCVRNALLGEPVEDIDIATLHTPEEVIETLSKADIKTVPTGIDHGTITAVIDKRPFEITTLRKDIKTDGRRAVVAFSKDWREDAARRDFTMNTLLMDIDGNVFDPLGGALDDLKTGKVIFVGNPEARIAEDILRILRFFRFHAKYGKAEPDAAALNACAKAADQIPSLSRERITQEFFKILSVDDPSKILGLMFENNILKEFLFNQNQLETLSALCHFQNRYNLGFIASRLYVLADFDLKNIAGMESLLLIPKVFKKDIEAMDQVLKLDDLAEDHALKVAIYKHGRVAAAQSLMIQLAQDRVGTKYAPDALDIIQNWDIPTFPISGEDLIKEGFSEGAELGQELTRREEAWIKDGFQKG